MSRDIPAEMLANLSDGEVYPFFAIEFNFDSGPIRVWTGSGILSNGGNDYTGSGELLTISSVEETSEIAVKGATLTMSGIPSELLSLALSTPYQGRLCTIYYGMFDKVSETSSLTEIFVGYMDQMNIEEGPETSSIEMRIENRLIDLERARIARFTNGYQISQYPQDRGLEFVESLQDQDLPWGKEGTRSLSERFDNLYGSLKS